MPSCLSTQKKSKHLHSRPHHREADKYKCILCEKFHPLRFCKKFLKMSLKRKEAFIQRHAFCINCLAQSHDLRSCTSLETCRKCDTFHHTLLHPPYNIERKFKKSGPRKPSKPKPATSENKASTSNSRLTSKPKYKQARKRNASQSSSSTAEQISSHNKAPDTRVILEAIKSWAQVLCTDGKNATVA